MTPILRVILLQRCAKEIEMLILVQEKSRQISFSGKVRKELGQRGVTSLHTLKLAWRPPPRVVQVLIPFGGMENGPRETLTQAHRALDPRPFEANCTGRQKAA
eukprot:6184193-Pleurochrysis_carterae.AAC.1